MRVLIIGATGNVGGHTMEHALSAGHDVTAFGRSADSIDDSPDRLATVVGDVTEADDVDAAVRDHDVVILTFGAPINTDTVVHQPSVCEDGTRLVVDAMKRHGVHRLVCMTAIGAGDSEGHGRFVFRNIIEPLMLGRIMKDRTAQEEVVRTSQLPEWVIVRPTELTDGDSASVRIIEDLDAEPEPTTIARTDVGATLVDLIDTHTYDGRTILITNDE